MKTVQYLFAIICFMALPFIAYGQSSNFAAPKSADTLTNPYKVNKPFLKTGSSLFKTDCASCHGESGKGNGPASMAFNPRPANLTAKYVQDEKAGALYWKIYHGKGSMPAWGKSLKRKEIWAIVSYIKTDLSKHHK